MTLLPHPVVTFVIVILWMMLTSFTLGNLILGILAGIAAGIAYRRLTPDPIVLRNPRAMLRLFLRVGGDIVRSNYAVARLILREGRHPSRRSGFVRVPLEMTNPNGLAVLAVIITATPGTAWIEYDPRDGGLLLHVFDLVEQDDWSRIIKTRYEYLLMEIFE